MWIIAKITPAVNWPLLCPAIVKNQEGLAPVAPPFPTPMFNNCKYVDNYVRVPIFSGYQVNDIWDNYFLNAIPCLRLAYYSFHPVISYCSFPTGELYQPGIKAMGQTGLPMYYPGIMQVHANLNNWYIYKL